MKVKLTYFRASGKYATEGEYETAYSALYVIWEEVADKNRSGTLPGVVAGTHMPLILIDVPEHEYNHPHMIVSRVPALERVA